MACAGSRSTASTTHVAITPSISADDYPDDFEVPSFALRLKCSKCGGRRVERAPELERGKFGDGLARAASRRKLTPRWSIQIIGGKRTEFIGEDEDWLHHVASEMDVEDGVIWVYGLGEDGVMALTGFGIENLIELIKIYEENNGLLRR